MYKTAVKYRVESRQWLDKQNHYTYKTPTKYTCMHIFGSSLSSILPKRGYFSKIRILQNKINHIYAASVNLYSNNYLKKLCVTVSCIGKK